MEKRTSSKDKILFKPSDDFRYDIVHAAYFFSLWAVSDKERGPDLFDTFDIRSPLLSYILFYLLGQPESLSLKDKLDKELVEREAGDVISLTTDQILRLTYWRPILNSKWFAQSTVVVFHRLNLTQRNFLEPVTILFHACAEIVGRLLESTNTPYNINQNLALFMLYPEHPDREAFYKRFGINIEEALRGVLEQDVSRIYRTIRGKISPSVDKDDICGFYDELIVEWLSKFPGFAALSEKERLLLRLETDKEANYIPNAVKMDVIDEYRKYEEDKDQPWQKSLAYLNESINPLEFIPDIAGAVEVEKVTALVRWIETLPDPTDRGIAELKFIKGRTVRQINEALSTPRSTVQDRLKKLNKLKPF